MTTKQAVTFLALAATLAAASGCKKTAGNPGGNLFSIPKPGGGPSNPLGLAREDVALRDKLQPVIHCINDTFGYYENYGPVYRRRLTKLMNPPPKRGPYDVEIPDIDVFSYGKFYKDDRSAQTTLDCATGLEKSASLPPSLPDLDGPAKDEAAALRAMTDPGQQMDSYMDQKGYLDDHFAKARSLDAELSPLLARMQADSSKLRRAVRVQESTLKQHELTAIESHEGRSLHWHSERSMIAARALNDQLVADFRERKMTAQGVDAAIQPLQTAFDEGEAYARAHPDERKRDGNGMEPVWFSLVSDFTGELAAAKELRQDLQNYPTPSDSPADKLDTLKRQVDNVNSEFNNAVFAYNQDVQSHSYTVNR